MANGVLMMLIVSKIAKRVNGIVTFTHEQNINERIKLMNKFSQIFKWT